jgi:hypothetical protein
MISDFNQPARMWLADMIDNFGTLLDRGEDPSVTVDLGNKVHVEVRLTRLGDDYNRERLEVHNETEADQQNHTQASEGDCATLREGEATPHIDRTEEAG